MFMEGLALFEAQTQAVSDRNCATLLDYKFDEFKSKNWSVEKKIRRLEQDMHRFLRVKITVLGRALKLLGPTLMIMKHLF